MKTSLYRILMFALAAFAISCNKHNGGENGPYTDLGTNWQGAIMQTEDNGEPITDSTWGPAGGVTVLQHGNVSGNITTSSAVLGGLIVKMMTPEADSDLELEYVNKVHDSAWGITSTSTYTGTGELLDENNATLSLTVDVQDDLFGNFNGAFQVKMTRLDASFMPIDDRVDVNSSGSTTSALTSSEMRDYLEYGVDTLVLEHLHLVAHSVPTFFEEDVYLALLNAYLN